jgi:uncharacterized protein (TIGR03435 family)
VVKFDLAEELKTGERVLDIPALFPRNAAAEAFAARRQEANGSWGWGATTGSIALMCVALGLVVYGWRQGGRGFKFGLAALVAIVVVLAGLSAVVLQLHTPTSAPWVQFSIGPASGESMTLNPSGMRANGITLKTGLAIAHGVPPVRVIGPAWQNDTRYSVNAVAGTDGPDSFRSLFEQEWKTRLRLKTHVEVRSFDVFVLTATEAPRLERSLGRGPSTWFSRQDVQLQAATMERLADALQAIVRTPVVDETGITGSYNLEFGWTDDRVASVTTVLHDRFGLRLSPGTRDLDALIVDGIRRDPALMRLAQVGRLTSRAPQGVRQQTPTS